MSQSLTLLSFLIVCIVSFAGVRTNTVDEEALNALPQAIRQSPSPLVQVLNTSSEGMLDNDAVANVTNISLSDIENDNATHSLQMRYRERKKQERIIIIQAQILHRLRIDRQPNISSMLSEEERQKFLELYERMQNGNNGNLEMAAQGMLDPVLTKLQSFYPSCSIPNNTDRPLWESAESLRIYYDSPFNRYAAGSDISIMLAKLRIFRVAGNADPNFIGWNTNQENSPRHNQLESLVNSRAANGINVNVYQFMKPLRSNRRERKRLIDTRTVDIDYQGWVEFNVIDSLNTWLHNTNKNYGFDVQVEDPYGNKLNPNLYFQNINCSGEIPQDPPFPNIMELHPEMGENESSLLDNETYPTLDLQTAEIPRDFTDLDALADRLNSDRVIRRRSSKEDGENSCRSEEVYVTFAEMGLDSYILWPPGVLWTFCEGNCGPTQNIDQRRDSFYSTWIHRLFRIKPRESTSNCIVTTRESIPVILNDGDTEEFQTVIEDIVPTSCGCRAT